MDINYFAIDEGEVPWGTFFPSDPVHIVITKLVEMGLGRGHVRDLMRKVWFSRKRGDGDKVVDCHRYSLKWRLIHNDNETDWRLMFASKHHDRTELTALSAAYRDGVFVDLGANVGFHTLMLAKQGARVVAFEPNPLAYSRLRYHVHLNKLGETVEVSPLGVGDEGRCTLHFNGLETGSTVIQRESWKQVDVDLIPLPKALLSLNVSTVDAIKVDVEGTEDRALIPFFDEWPPRGWPKCIVLEDHLQKYWKQDVVGYLTNIGYRIDQRTNKNVILVK